MQLTKISANYGGRADFSCMTYCTCCISGFVVAAVPAVARRAVYQILVLVLICRARFP